MWIIVVANIYIVGLINEILYKWNSTLLYAN